MRLVAWNCSMALHRKAHALMALYPDVAVVAECASAKRLRKLCGDDWMQSEPVWIGRRDTKGLAVFTFNGYRAELDPGYDQRFDYVAPVRISGPASFNLLAVWAQNASAGIRRKHQAGPLRRALARYREFLGAAPCFVAGDFNNNPIWDRPGWRINHAHAVAALDRLGLVSAYHALTGEAAGAETQPTHYWRDRRKDGPTYHIDYVFVPRERVEAVREMTVGTFEDWCGNGLSDHVPLVVDVDLSA